MHPQALPASKQVTMIEQLHPRIVAAVLELCAVPEPDVAACTAMLRTEAGEPVLSALAALDARWGSFPAEGLRTLPGVDSRAWIEALLRFAPVTAARMEEMRIPAAVIEATLADIGAQLHWHRRTHGGFGLDTAWWTTLHLSGSLFRLGRLQFHLHRDPANGPWAVGLHIPEDGALDANSVDASLRLAATFFAEHFPAQRIDHAYCDSWLLDPHLAGELPNSNMAGFAARFTNVELREEPGDALYFTFRVPADAEISTLPRDSSLQRVVLERIEGGGSWQVGKGLAPWPMPVG
jgi:hypothetical protein